MTNPVQKVKGNSTVKESRRPILEAQKIKISSASDLKLKITWSREMLFQCWLGSLKNMLLSPFPKALKKKKSILPMSV